MRKELALLISGLLLGLFNGCAVNPITGEEELMLISEEQDIQIGRQYAPEVEKEMGGKINDPVIQNYVNYVGQTVARVSHRPNFEYSFVALNDKSINAFALPGGYIFVTKGMLQNIQTEAQLAAILAHEITHVVARDVSNAMSNQIGINLLLSAVTSEKTPQSVLMVANLTQQIVGLRFSRQDEKEADLGGLDYMVKAGYNPYGMVETMQMLQTLNQSRPIEFLSSHPSPENRIGYITQTIQTKYFNLAGLKIAKNEYSSAVLSRLNK